MSNLGTCLVIFFYTYVAVKRKRWSDWHVASDFTPVDEDKR